MTTMNAATLLTAAVVGMTLAATNGLKQEDWTRWPVPCSDHYTFDDVIEPGCTPQEGGSCGRMVLDDFLSKGEVATLVSIAERGMAMAPQHGAAKGGPTIMDVNSGWVLGSGQTQPVSIYRNGPLFSAEDYGLYRRVIERLKKGRPTHHITRAEGQRGEGRGAAQNEARASLILCFFLCFILCFVRSFPHSLALWVEWVLLLIPRRLAVLRSRGGGFWLGSSVLHSAHLHHKRGWQQNLASTHHAR